MGKLHSDQSTKFLAGFRSRLESRNLPAETINTLVELVSTALSTSETASAADYAMLARLAQACEDNITLLALITQQAGELDALKRITLNLASSLELEVVLGEVVQEALRLVKDACLVQIHLYQEGRLIPSTSLDALGEQNMAELQIQVENVIQQVTSSQQLKLLEKAETGDLFPPGAQSWCGSIIGLPLKMGNHLVGVMVLARSQAGSFNKSGIRLMNLLADQASIAIVNARLHQAVNQQARFDVLTGLPNRLSLEEKLQEEIAVSQHTGQPFSLIMMDLDGFKRINDSHGHDTGDDVLHQMAHFLQGTLRTNDFVARFGGDEFTLVLPDTNLEQSQAVAGRLFLNLADFRFLLPGEQTTTINVSGGIVMYPLHALTPSELLRSADEALYCAKRTNPGSFQVGVNRNA